MVDDVRAPAELRHRVVPDRPPEVAARLERDPRGVACGAHARAGAHGDRVAGVVDVRDVLDGRLCEGGALEVRGKWGEGEDEDGVGIGTYGRWEVEA